VGSWAIGAAARTATAVRQRDCGCALAMILLDDVVLTHLH
jgi:hypothetical protein